MFILRKKLIKAAILLKNNKIVALPTDTVYGLSCIINYQNICKINKLKKRDNKKYFIIISGFLNHIQKFLDLSKIDNFHFKKIYYYLNYHPITWVAPKNKKYYWLNSDSENIAFRITNNFIIKNITHYLDDAIISTSANFSNHEYAKCYNEVLKLFEKKIDYILKINNNFTKQKPSKIINLLTDQIIRS